MPYLLPTKSPWLNANESKWILGKRKVVEPERLLTAYKLADKVCREDKDEPWSGAFREVARRSPTDVQGSIFDGSVTGVGREQERTN